MQRKFTLMKKTGEPNSSVGMRGLVIFNFHVPKLQHVFIVMMFGTNANVRDLRKPLFLTLDPQI